MKIPGRILSVKNNALDLDIEAAFKGFGSRDGSFVLGLSVQLASLGSKPSGLDEHGMAFLASIVAGVSPRDTTEALLATQMAAIHKSIMLMTKRLGEAENIAQQDSAERALNKLVVSA